MTSYPNCPSDRQTYIDGSIADISRHEFFQPKYDGIWSRVVGEETGRVLVFSRTQTLKAELRIEGYPSNSVFLAEYMFGSQWSQHPDRLGKFYFFDCLVSHGEDYTVRSYQERYREMLRQLKPVGSQDNRINFVPNFAVQNLQKFWDKISVDHSFEGVVGRNWKQTYSDPLYRLKIDITDDFVIMKVNEGQGRLAGTMGSLTIGQFDGDELVEIMTVGGGFSDELRKEIWANRVNMPFQVIEVVGKARFTSGALRHPNFVRFRPDKAAVECKFKNQEEQ